MIREFLRRRKQQKYIGIVRRESSCLGISVDHLTDDELTERMEKFAAKMGVVVKESGLTLAEISEGLALKGE